MKCTQICSIWLLVLFLSLPAAAAGETRHMEFGQFAVELPPGWEGDEQTGFISDNPEEYMLILGRKDAEGDKFIAQISIYLLPNKPGATPEQAARTLADAQGEPTEPVLRGNLWQFEGEPRSNVIKARAVTMVNANKERMLIIIVQDPEKLGAEKIVENMKAVTPKAKELLGR